MYSLKCILSTKIQANLDQNTNNPEEIVQEAAGENTVGPARHWVEVLSQDGGVGDGTRSDKT